MPRQTSASSRAKSTPESSPAKSRPLTLVVIDQDPAVRAALEPCPALANLNVHFLSDLAQVRAFVTAHPVDLVLLEPQTADGGGIKLMRELLTHRPTLQLILMTNRPTLNLAVDAMRAGVSDLLAKPLKAEELTERLRQAVERCRANKRVHNRVRNLRKLCRSLDQARQDIAQQVDVLCNDLVSAYQELASQMQQAIQSSEFNAVVRSELDLEQFVRKLLEYVLDKAGPTNAAVFLPSGSDEFALGGYINYDCSAETPDFLLQHLADTLAPKLVAQDNVVQVASNEQLAALLGDGWRAIEDTHLLAVTCRHEGEGLAVIVLFRHHAQPFDEDMPETLDAIAQTVGQSLARIIRVHHRHLPHDDDSQTDGPDLEAA